MLKGISYYLLSNAWDYFWTEMGLALTMSPEGNPLILQFINRYGNIDGLLYHKIVMTILVITLLSIVYKKHPMMTRYILYIGSILMFVGGTLWIPIIFKT